MPKERPFNWFSPTHLRYARQGRYRDIPYLDRYYNSAMDRFVSKAGRGEKGALNKDLYRSTYVSGALTPPKGYFFDVGRAELVPNRRIIKNREIVKDGLVYRGPHRMRELMPTTGVRVPLPTPAAGRYTIEAALYGRRHPSREESRQGDSAVRKLSVFGRPVRRLGSHGTNDALMGGEQIILRELRTESLDLSAEEFAHFQRVPQENRLYLLNTDDFLLFFKLCRAHGIAIDPSMFHVIKIKGVSVGREGGRVSEAAEPM